MHAATPASGNVVQGWREPQARQYFASAGTGCLHTGQVRVAGAGGGVVLAGAGAAGVLAAGGVAAGVAVGVVSARSPHPPIRPVISDMIRSPRQSML
jgi:hypothetical protein